MAKVNTTSEQKGGTTLLLIDVQNSFHPGGSLGIPTANEDAKRIVDLISSHGDKINRIVATLDSHHKLHVAHPYFWMAGDDESKQPDPFTIISAADIEQGKWKPRPNIRIEAEELLNTNIFENPESVMTNGSFDLSKYALEYAKRLEARGRFQICVWPEHCLIGSEGHNVVPTVRKAMDEWSVRTGGSIEWVMKGENLLTEMYSALAADVPVSKATSFNEALYKSLMKSDRLIVAGQAMSHCVNYTLRDMVENCQKEETAKIVLLTDCASPVPGFEAAAETFQKDMKTAGVQLMPVSDIAGIL
jgi:nicotinamidase-related amidase